MDLLLKVITHITQLTPVTGNSRAVFTPVTNETNERIQPNESGRLQTDVINVMADLAVDCR